MNQNYLNALQKKLSVLVLTLILTVTLPGLVLAMDLGAQLGGLQTKLVGLKGKLGQLKGGLENLKNALDGKAPEGGGKIDVGAAIEEDKLNSLINARKQSIVLKKLNDGLINLLKKESVTKAELVHFEDNITALVASKQTATDEALLRPIIAKLKKFDEILSSDSDSDSGAGAGPEKAQFVATDFLIKSLEQDTPTQDEFNAKKDDYITTFFDALSSPSYTNENIDDVIKKLQASHTCFTTNSPQQATRNLAIFKDIQSLVDFLHGTYLNKILGDANSLTILRSLINSSSKAQKFNQLINEYDKLYNLPKLSEREPAGKNKGKTKLEIKEDILKESKIAKDAAKITLTTTLNSYNDSEVLTLQQINSLIKGNALKQLKQDSLALHKKADTLIANNLTDDFFSRNLKTELDQTTLKNSLTTNGCDNAFAKLNSLIKTANDAKKALIQEKNGLIAVIKTTELGNLMSDDALATKTIADLKALLNRLQGKSGNAGGNAAGGVSGKAALDAIVVAKRPVPLPPPPPPGADWDVSSWTRLTDDEKDTIITNKDHITKPINPALKALVKEQKSEFADKGADGLAVLKALGISP